MNHIPQTQLEITEERAQSEMPAVQTDEDLPSRARKDRLRPLYHFLAPGGWLNDANGVGWRDGLYHLFYQYNPLGAFHHGIHWGHAVSTDLLHWRDRPIALTPGEGADEDGCWSGVLVDSPHGPALVYSGRRGESELPCVAYGSADLDTWHPQPQPIIDSPPQGYVLTAFRDHCVWFEDGTWRQLVGSGIQGQGGCAFLYESEDFEHWRSRGPLVVGEAGEIALENPEWTGTMWECVDFFRMTPGRSGTTGVPDGRSEDPHVMIFSAWHEHRTLHSMAAVGSYDGRTFTPDSIQRLDLGGRFAYAPQTFVDGAGRRVLWAWMQEGRTESSQQAAGWSGAMAVPRHIWLNESLRVCAEPVAELSRLRQRQVVAEAIEEIGTLELGQSADLELSLQIPLSAAVEIELLATPNGTDGDAESTLLRVYRDSADQVTLSVDRSSSSLDPSADASARSGPVPHQQGQPLQVRILLDRSSLEVFAEGVSLTTRVYPTRSDAEYLRLYPSGGASVSRLSAWQMKPTEQSDRRMSPESHQ